MAIFTGAGVAIVTPFKENLEVDYNKLEEIIDYQIDNGTDSIIICLSGRGDKDVVQVKALKSVDLINWTETTATATGETSSGGKFKIYKATVPIGEEGKVFLKLQVEEKE